MLELQWSTHQPGEYTFNVVAFIEDGDDLSKFKFGGSSVDFDNKIKSFYRLGNIIHNLDKWWILKDPNSDEEMIRSISLDLLKKIDSPILPRRRGCWYPPSYDHPIQEIINLSLSDLKADISLFLKKIR